MQGQVIRQDRGVLEVLTAEGKVLARPSGRLRHQARDAVDLPVVGDLVELNGIAIQAVLPRKSLLVRREAGREAGGEAPQLIAANVDLALIVEPLDRPARLSRLERMVAFVRSGGVAPAVVLSKADFHPAPEDAARSVREALAGAGELPVVVVSARTGAGMEALAPLLRSGTVVALLGASGAGKSTLVNHLLGEERLPTGPVRAFDAKGRHTTSWRELLDLPSGARIIDGPGMRELGLWAAGGDELESTFADVETLSRACRFRDCAHQGEPGCAVQAAIDQGDLPAERLEHLHKLRREQSRGSPERRRLERLLGRATRDVSRDKRRR